MVPAASEQVAVAVVGKPTIAGFGVTETLQAGPVDVVAVALLLPRFGSDSLPETPAVALIVPGLLGNIVNVSGTGWPLEARPPIAQLTFVPLPELVDVQLFGDKLTIVLFGIEAVSVTPVAFSGPVLLTLSV